MRALLNVTLGPNVRHLNLEHAIGRPVPFANPVHQNCQLVSYDSQYPSAPTTPICKISEPKSCVDALTDTSRHPTPQCSKQYMMRWRLSLITTRTKEKKGYNQKGQHQQLIQWRLHLCERSLPGLDSPKTLLCILCLWTGHQFTYYPLRARWWTYRDAL